MINPYSFLRPLLFQLDPEVAHDLALSNMKRAEQLGLLKYLTPCVPSAPLQVCGIDFPNPVGLAAGLDKDGRYIDALAALGFGFLEIGTVTPLAQVGNPKPRMFRLPSANALINRMGFNNDGVTACVERVKQSRYWQNGGVLGMNIGKNAITPIERASEDYIKAMNAVYEVATYITVNISSPNTKNLRDLQNEEQLKQLLNSLNLARTRLSQQYGIRKPLFLKIAPDLNDAEIQLIADLLLEYQIDAVIATNTTVARDAIQGLNHSEEVGGLSGAPLISLSNRVIQTLHRHLQNQIPIIGVGGILTGSDAKQKIDAGARLVQIYTGLIYQGPQLIQDSVRAIQN